MEIGMQHFVVDDLPPEDQKTVRKYYFRMGFGYAAVILLACLSILARTPGAQFQAEKQAMPPASGLFSTVAATAPDRALCAAHDLKLITQLNEHGEALDVPADDLRNAFMALVDARKICFSGRVAEALAIYDSVIFGGVKTASGGPTAQQR